MIIRLMMWIGLLLLAALSAHTLPDSKNGVIIESVASNSEGAKAGLLPVDMIVSWSRDDVKGEIETPFDFLQIEVEQKARGHVVVEGLRGSEKQRWTLGPDIWGVQTRPELPEGLLSVYRLCQTLSKVVATASPRDQCNSDAVTDGPVWLRSWFAFQAAEALAGAREWQLSDGAYGQSVRLGRQAGPAIAALLLNRWATTYEGRGDLENAEKRYQESLLEYQKLDPDSLAVAADLNGLGSVARKRGDLAKAEDYSNRALAIEEKLAPESLNVAISLNNLGNIAWARRDLTAATQHHQRALKIRESLAPGSLAVAGSLNNLSLIATQQDHLDVAEDYQLQALAIREVQAPGSMDLAASFNNLGNIRWTRGDLAKAEQYYRQAFDIRQKLAPGSLDLADILNNLSLVAERRGELMMAEQYCRQALSIRQNHGAETLETANIIHNLANVLWERGERGAAHDLDLRALQLREKLAPNDLETAAGLTNLGLSAQEEGNLEEAEKYDLRALELEKQLAPESLIAGLTLHQLGDIAQARRDLATAERFYREALGIQEKLAPGTTSHAETLLALARVMSHAGQAHAASTFFEQALEALEGQAARLGGAEDVRYNFRGRHAAYYADYIDLLFKQKEYALAFQVVERSRAQSLLEMLNGGRVDIYAGVDPGLLDRKRQLEQLISSKFSDRIDISNSAHTQEQLVGINEEIRKLLSQYQQISDQIRVGNPGYAGLTHPEVLNLTQVQDELLDADTLLLEYSLGETRSHIWAVTKTSVAAYELPNRTTVEAAARRVYKLLAQPGLQDATGQNAEERRWKAAVTDLSQIVLGPVAGHLGKERLIIVADGALQYIPFEALPAPRPVGTKTKRFPLVEEHEIVYLPSASVLAVLRRAAKGRRVPSKAVAVLADPVFDKDDPRVLASPATQTSSKAAAPTPSTISSPGEHFTRSKGDLGLEHLPRLPFSRREADTILALTPPGQGAEFTDFKASRTMALNPSLADYNVIHFATHGLVDSRIPELSGLVLSLVDQTGQFQNGFLDLQDIYNLNLRADLVVLSACETALGKEVRGDGLIGLTRGFMFAGASRVLASLWKVDDVATAELMRIFYNSMQKKGMRPAEALRRAQIAMRKQPRWSHPYFWAGFQLQGDWK